ncbi:P-loop NTPase fold protein [Pseudomonas atacamensis]|uniref:P-loop NTPase fold protein n=1 Tax=Pseudomonas atacamensis TaxID=2565368 RepID=UPI00300EB97E
MDILNFQSENPSERDAFKGESHDRVAQAIHEYISSGKNYRVIGLDGEFGSGKSSILQMLERKIKEKGSKSVLWMFDCEQNYQGSIKSNFIELFTDKITELLKVNGKEEVIPQALKTRDIALGRHFSYTKDTRSHISVWAVLLIASGVLSPTFIRDYLPQLRASAELPWWQHFFYLTTSLAPVIILILAYFFNGKEQVGKKRWNISSLLKGSSDDQITETIEISKEVSPLDLKRALRNHLNAVKENHFIIVIDNLDRLPRDILRSVWSDLEIFTSVSVTNLSVIVPFCSTKVSKYLNGDTEQSYDSKDFIAKKFPVVFRTPPIITSGWKDAFRALWSETFGPASPDDADACSIILQRHSPMAGGLVTPRLQKRFINDIATTLLVTAGRPSVVCIAAYIVICKYNNISIESMLKDDDDSLMEVEASSATVGDKDLKEASNQKLVKTKRTLHALFGADMEQGWPIQILQIHFQTSSDIAIAELIDQPLATAIESQDGKKFSSLVPYFGFADSFRRGLETEVSPNNLFLTLYEAASSYGCDVSTLMPHINKRFSENPLLETHVPEAGFFEAIKGLISLGLSKTIFDGKLNAAHDSFLEMNGQVYDSDSEESYKKIINLYDGYLNALDYKFPEVTLYSSEMLFHMLVPNPNLLAIDTSRIFLNQRGRGDAVRQIVSNESVNFDMTPLAEEDWVQCLYQYFGDMKLSLKKSDYQLDDEEAASIIVAINTDPSDERAWLALAFFEKYSSSVTALIKSYAPTIKSNFIKIAMAVVYIRQDMGAELVEIPEIESAFIQEPEFLNALLGTLVTTGNLFALALQSESKALITPLLVRVIRERKVANIFAYQVYRKYTELCEVLSEGGMPESEFLEWFTSFALATSNVPSLDQIDARFLEEILNGANDTLLAFRAHILNRDFGAEKDSSSWLAIFNSPNPRVASVLNHMVNDKLDFTGEKNAHAAISSYFSSLIKQSPFVEPPHSVIKNISSVLALFDKDARVIIGTELRAWVYDRDISLESSVFIMSELGYLLPNITPRNVVEEERLLQIFLFIHRSPDTTSRVSEFLDCRWEQLAGWSISKEHKDTYASYVSKLKDRLPKVHNDLSNKTGFKARMKKFANAFIARPTDIED